MAPSALGRERPRWAAGEVGGVAMLAAVATLTVAAVACSLVPTPTPEEFPELGITFAPTSQMGEAAVSAEEAIETIRERGLTIVRPPDVVEYGLATCVRREPCHRFDGALWGPHDGPRPIWRIRWLPEGGGDWLTAFVFAESGDWYGGIGGG